MQKKNKEGLEKTLKKNKRFLFVLLFIFLWIIVPPLINLMLKAKTIFFPNFFGFVNSENFDAWVGFYGDIIGGVITLIGVAWTIVDQNKKREDDLKNALKPILIATSCTYEKIKGINNENESKVFECCLEYKNVGKGVLYNPMVFNIEYFVDGKHIGKMHPAFSVKSSIDIGATADNTVMIEFDSSDLKNIAQLLKGRGNVFLVEIIMYVGGKDMYGRDVVTKLYYKVEIACFGENNMQLSLFGGTLTSEVLFSEEEINDVINKANRHYNVHL